LSSEYGSKSYTDLKKQAKQDMCTAGKAEPSFLVTEKNWNGLLSALSGILEMQAQFSEQMQTLATRQELDQTLDRQRTMVQFHLEDMKARTTEFRTSIETMGTNLEKQIGKASDEFSKKLSDEKTSMSKWSKKMLWISAIPSATLVLLELVPLLWSAVFPG
jgi:Zn-dependent oligopeptidase